MQFDHAIIAVTDLDLATKDFTELGFTIQYGGEHAGGLTHNALVIFGDGSYIELVAPTDAEFLVNPPPPGPGNYLFLFDHGEGFAGFVFQTNDLDGVVERARERGIAISDPTSGGRIRQDGVELAWRTAFPPDSTFPFFMTDETPRQDRVPTDAEFTTHANGAQGIVRTTSVVENLQSEVDRYAILLGVDRREGPPEANAETASFTVGELEAILVAPKDPRSPMDEHLQARGDSLYQIEIEASREMNVKSHGARILLG